MNKDILAKEVQDFIINYSEDVSKLAFAGSPFEAIPVHELIQQIESRRKSEKKLPLWYTKNAIYYPAKIHIEQTSSEITAKHKTSLIQCKSLADITGGFGVDSYYFSQNIDTLHHFEKNQLLSSIAKHNFNILGKKSIQCFDVDGLQAVSKRRYNIIYADPSRRHDSKGKVFFLSDCEPNIPENLKYLLKQCDKMLIKTSPMLDITVGLKELRYVYQIHIVAVNNEVKELLWLLDKEFDGKTKVKAVNFRKEEIETFEFNSGDIEISNYDLPKKYLYEPNAAIMKSGGFGLLSNRFNIKKLEKNSHLFTSDQLIDFPGRRFQINKIIPYHKKDLKNYFKNRKANITTRNFSETVASLKKRWKIIDGGNDYLFFTTLVGKQKVILECTKI